MPFRPLAIAIAAIALGLVFYLWRQIQLWTCAFKGTWSTSTSEGPSEAMVCAAKLRMGGLSYSDGYVYTESGNGLSTTGGASGMAVISGSGELFDSYEMATYNADRMAAGAAAGGAVAAQAAEDAGLALVTPHLVESTGSTGDPIKDAAWWLENATEQWGQVGDYFESTWDEVKSASSKAWGWFTGLF